MSDTSRILIDGRWVAARATETRPVINPATLEPLGAAPECGAADVEAAVSAAARAQPAWWKIPGVEKATFLHQIATKIRARAGEQSRLMTRMKAMEGVKAGTFWVNDPLTDNDGAPFGGMRWSGVGRELGEEGLDAFREPKHVHVDYLMEAKNYWYPYRERKLPEH
jgi:acyl-CoA reductase-like NAD-dependent aldehyde dehydrogenase